MGMQTYPTFPPTRGLNLYQDFLQEEASNTALLVQALHISLISVLW